MLFRIHYTLDAESSNVRWTPLIGDEIREHHPRNDRLGDLTIDAPNVAAAINRMRSFADVIAFGVNPIADGV